MNDAVERLGTFSRDAFGVGLTLAEKAAVDACTCALRPQGSGDGECRRFAGSLSTATAARQRCPQGLSVVAHPLALPGRDGLALASQGFLESGEPAPTALAGNAGGVPTLGPGEAGQLERFVGLGAALLSSLGTSQADPETAREAAWHDLLGAPSAVGGSAIARTLREQLPAAAAGSGPLFLAGEPGSGRRFLAAAVHRLGPRAGRPFLAENLALLPRDLQETELFGAGGYPGLMDDAEDGTLFLGGVERLTPASQQRLLERLAAGDGPRVLASADEDLDEAVRGGRFLAPLAERLRARSLRAAPLRERAEDVPEIALHLVRRRAAAAGTAAPELARETLEVLRDRAWPGNVRELDDVLARAAAGRSVVRPEDLSGPRPAAAHRTAPAAEATLREVVSELETELIERALAGANWNKSRAARTLGLSRLGLQKKIDRYGIDRRR